LRRRSRNCCKYRRLYYTGWFKNMHTWGLIVFLYSVTYWCVFVYGRVKRQIILLAGSWSCRNCIINVMVPMLSTFWNKEIIFPMYGDFWISLYLYKTFDIRRVVDIVTRLQAWRSGIRILTGEINFYIHRNVHTGSGTYPASYWMGTGIPSLGGKAAGAWYWPLPSSAQGTNKWSYTSTPSYMPSRHGQEQFCMIHDIRV
jgi:hypothetical protein